MFKRWDFIIIAILMIFSFLPEVIFGFVVGRDFDQTYAEISINGKIEKTIPLTNHTGEEIIYFKSDKGHNTIIINGDKIGIIDADCSDKVCMNPEYISKPGETLVCLPHKFMIEVKGKKNNEDEDIILSH